MFAPLVAAGIVRNGAGLLDSSNASRFDSKLMAELQGPSRYLYGKLMERAARSRSRSQAPPLSQSKSKSQSDDDEEYMQTHSGTNDRSDYGAAKVATEELARFATHLDFALASGKPFDAAVQQALSQCELDRDLAALVE